MNKIKKLIAGTTAVVFFYTLVATPLAEANFWEERHQHLQEYRSQKNGDPLVLARASVQNPAELIHHLPQIQPSRFQSPKVSILESVKKQIRETRQESLLTLIESLPHEYGTIRKIFFPPNAKKIEKKGPVVLHIQDVHGNLEAQENIGKTIQALIDQKMVSLVGLEAAFNPIDLEPFHSFPHQESLHKAAQYLFLKGDIPGPILTGLTSSHPLPPFIGIDDPKHYQANVRSFQKAAPLIPEMKQTLQEASKQLENIKVEIFSKNLLNFDRQVELYRKGKISLGAYVQTLAEQSQKVPPTVQWFSKALKMEKELDFDVVERERKTLINALVQKLRPSDLNELFHQSLAYRKGQVGYGAFYRYLQDLCQRKGINVQQFPQMKKYLSYVLLSDRIEPEALFQELRGLEKSIYHRLAQTKEEEDLLVRSKRVYLSEKLLDFSLIPDEWKEHRSLSQKSLTTPGKKSDLDLSFFEEFYHHAHSRDHAMAENLLKATKNSGIASTDVAVLVTGGFHSQGISKQLNHKGVTVINFVPKMTKVENSKGTSYLSVFSQEKTPLEKLFEGQKLFLAEKPFTAFKRFKVALYTGAKELWLRRGLSSKSVKDMVRRLAPEKQVPDDFELVLENGKVSLVSAGSRVKLGLVGPDGQYLDEEPTPVIPSLKKRILALFRELPKTLLTVYSRSYRGKFILQNHMNQNLEEVVKRFVGGFWISRGTWFVNGIAFLGILVTGEWLPFLIAVLSTHMLLHLAQNIFFPESAWVEDDLFVQRGEVAVTQSGIKPLFIGDTPKQVRELNSRLGPIEPGVMEKEYEGVTYRVRKSGRGRVWAFELSNAAKVETTMGWNLRSDKGDVKKIQDEDLPIQRGEVAVSQSGIKPLFVGDTPKQVRKLNGQLGPIKPGVKEIKYKGVTYRVRKSGRGRVWTFELSDAAKVGKTMGWVLRSKEGSLKEVQPEKVGVTVLGVKSLFVENSEKKAKDLNKKLGPIEPGVTEKDYKGVTYRVRKSGRGRVWTFELSDAAKVGKTMGWLLRRELKKVQPGEVTATKHGLSVHFVGDSERQVNDLKNHLGPIKPGVMEKDYEGVIYRVRTRSSSSVWAFSTSDVAQVGKTMGWALRRELKEVQSGEVSVTKHGLFPQFVGTVQEQSKNLNDHLGPIKPGVMEKKYKGVTYRVRRSGGAGPRVWVFKSSDVSQVGKTMGWPLRRELKEVQPGEVAVSSNGLFSQFVGHPVKQARALNDQLGPIKPGMMEKEYKGVTYRVRTKGVYSVWAFEVSDASQLGKTMGWKLRMDPDLKIEELSLFDAVALLGGDPLRLQQYIQIYHPELALEEVNSLVVGSLSGLGGEPVEVDPAEAHKDYTMQLPVPNLLRPTNTKITTLDNSLIISGRASPESRIQVLGAYRRKIVVRQDGTFQAIVPLPRTGEVNNFELYVYNDEIQQKSPPIYLEIEQIGKKEDIERVFLDLLALREDLLESIKKDADRLRFLSRRVEISLLKYFTQDENAGFAHLDQRIRDEESPILKKILEAVKRKFQIIVNVH